MTLTLGLELATSGSATQGLGVSCVIVSEDADNIDEQSLTVNDSSEANRKLISWNDVASPNELIITYEVNLARADGNGVVSKSINWND